MAVHERCHKAIHFGGPIRATSGSLAGKGDTGKGMTQQWKDFLNET